MSNDNTHRSLKSLVSVNAWFEQDESDPRRFALRARVSFREERLGGDAETKVTFKLSVKRCDMVFIPPNGPAFTVDPKSVKIPKPLNPKSVTMRGASETKGEGSGTLSLNPMNLIAGAKAKISHGRERSEQAVSEQTIDWYHEAWSTMDGNHAWSVDGRDLNDRRLAGPAIDDTGEPRLVLIDKRSDEVRERDEDRQLPPMAAIKVSCLREDIDIYEISFKNPEDEKLAKSNRENKKKREMVAREVLKEALIREGLLFGEIVTDPYAEMTICDVAITVTDHST